MLTGLTIRVFRAYLYYICGACRKYHSLPRRTLYTLQRVITQKPSHGRTYRLHFFLCLLYRTLECVDLCQQKLDSRHSREGLQFAVCCFSGCEMVSGVVSEVGRLLLLRAGAAVAFWNCALRVLCFHFKRTRLLHKLT